MRIRISIYIALVFIIVSGCAATPAGQVDDHIDSSNTIVSPHSDDLPFIATSFEDFETQMKSEGALRDVNLGGLNSYYIPTEIIQLTKANINHIRVKQTYVSLNYDVKDIDYEKFDDPHEKERAMWGNTISFVWYRVDDADSWLNRYIEVIPLEPLYKGSSYYYFNIIHPSEPDMVLAKSIYWIENGYCFNLDIPIDVYEDQIQKQTQEQKHQGHEAPEDEIKGMVVQNATAMQIKSVN